MKSLLKELTETFSPSGFEDAIRSIILREITPFADDIQVDTLGNIIARKGKRSQKGKRIMVAAHMDEIGLMVTHVDSNGFVRFTSLGGVSRRYLPGGRVRFMNGVSGLIGVERSESPLDVPPLEKMFIDVGASSAKDCPVEVGNVAAFDRPFVEIGDRVVAKSLDDRVGVAIAIEAMRNLKRSPNEVYFAFTTQEEVGVRGATTSAFGIDPEIGLAVDITLSGDTPNDKGVDVSLGKGPAIKIKDSGMISDPRVVVWMTRVAEKSRVPTQREVLIGGSTDARGIQITRAGVPVGCLSVPCRYVHSPSEMVDLRDVKNTVKLLTAMLGAPVDLG